MQNTPISKRQRQSFVRFSFLFPTLEWGVRGEDVVKKASEIFAAVYNFRADFNSAASEAMLLRRAQKYATAFRALTSSVCGEHRTYKAIRIGKTQTHTFAYNCICSFEFRHLCSALGFVFLFKDIAEHIPEVGADDSSRGSGEGWFSLMVGNH